MSQVIQARVSELLTEGRLDRGKHSSREDGACAMEWVSYLAGEGHTDAPACASPVLRRYVIALNDRWSDEQRQALVPYLPRMVGTACDGQDDARREIARQALVTDLLPAWMRLAGMDTEAELLATSTPANLSIRLSSIRSAAWRRRDEALEPIRAAVREKLATRPAVADAAAVAAAVADAVAVAVAAAVADAAAVAAAVAAAAADAAAVAAAAADAAAVAAAVADAAAVAAAAADGGDPWGPAYTAAYNAARPIFERAIEQGTAPRLVAIRDLAASQRTVALDVLDRMIDPAGAAR
ncbi:MAG: hypothetical protein QM582_09415 [Micropruina sp.]|uniref:hypothetical protein n=1 Tax=Micropruina sp. TaxID=2737536 RepID=UPI0039E6905E